MRRPLLIPALCVAAGIGAAEGLPDDFGRGSLLVACLGLALAGLWRRGFGVGLCLALFGAGALTHQATQWPLDPYDVRWRIDGRGELGRIRGLLAETPSVRLTERRGQWMERTVVRLRVTGWRPGEGEWERASGEVLVSSQGVPDARFFRGQSVEISGLVSAPPGPAAPGLFDYATFLRRQGVGLQVRCEAPGDWALGPGATDAIPWSERFLAWARRRLSEGLPDDGATRLIWAMALGWRTGLSGDVDDGFMRSGTLHVFAISGLHIALIAVLLVRVFRLLGWSRAVCGGLSLPLIWFYVAATGWQPSAVRSAVMTSVVVGTWMLERPGDLLNSLSLAALIVLLLDPGQLFQAGFLLSFLVVAALAVFPAPWEAWWMSHRPWRPDPLLPPSRWSVGRRVWEAGERFLCRGVCTGLAALVASWPVSVECFHLVSPISVAANLVVVPLSSLVLTANVLSLASPLGTGLWNAAAWTGMHGMMAASRACESIPGGWWSAASPGAWVWIPYTLLWVVAATVRLDTRRRRCSWGVAAGLWSALLLPGLRHPGGPSVALTVFRSGEAVWIDRAGSADDLLLDTGDASTAKAVVVPWLRSQGVDRVPNLAVSHGDVRHLGGVPVVLTSTPPHRLVAPVGRMRSPSFRALEGGASTAGIPFQRVGAGGAIAGLPVLHPDVSESHARADDGALVLRFEAAGWRILLAPDLGPGGQAGVIRREGDRLAADVLITGVPSSGEAASGSFLDRVRPRLIVIATGDRPATERSPPALRRRLRGLGIPTVWTERVGSVQLRCWDDRLEVRDARGNLRMRLDRSDQGRAMAW
ncbi:MAG: hypothetical protein RIT19_664 [Verrucomicrobiota bacterium]|jgi:ComEC/Rec2-related protein